MMNRIGGIIAGAMLVLLGFIIIRKPILYEPVVGAPYDLTGFNIPFGIAWIIVGGILIWVSWRIKSRNRNDKD